MGTGPNDWSNRESKTPRELDEWIKIGEYPKPYSLAVEERGYSKGYKLNLHKSRSHKRSKPPGLF